MKSNLSATLHAAIKEEDLQKEPLLKYTLFDYFSLCARTVAIAAFVAFSILRFLQKKDKLL